jgi:hypothetical protein
MIDDDYMLEILERAAPVPPSADVALEELRPRIRRARRRRAAMRGSAGLVVLVVLGGLVSQTRTDPTSRNVRVGSSDTTAVIESTTTSVAPSTTLAKDDGEDAAPPSTVAASDQLAAAPAGESGVGGRASGPAPAGATPSSSVAPARAGAQPAANRAPASRPAATPKPAASAPGGGTAPGAPQVTTFGSQAGTVEVVYTDTSMNLASVSPLPGWSVGTTESGDTGIQVTFESESGDEQAVDVEVHLDGGVPVVGAVEDTVEETVEGADDVVNVIAGS